MIWNTLLRLRAHFLESPSPSSATITTVSADSPDKYHAEIAIRPLSDSKGIELRFNTIGEHKGELCVIADSPFRVTVQPNHSLRPLEHQEIEQYLPYAVLPYFSHQHSKTFAISHFAQTLDGRIASCSGDSKWIGNWENLTHAHKMRAMCDAILVGASTLKTDQPRLNVRHVTGVNPLRVVIGNSISDDDIRSSSGEPVLVINTHNSTKLNEQVTLDAAVDGRIEGQAILRALYQRGVTSLYIEGGANTTSHFLKTLALDQVQVHVTPRILGSGVTGFEFGGVETIDQAVEFSNPRFVAMGNQMMFVGEVIRDRAEGNE